MEVDQSFELVIRDEFGNGVLDLDEVVDVEGSENFDELYILDLQHLVRRQVED